MPLTTIFYLGRNYINITNYAYILQVSSLPYRREGIGDVAPLLPGPNTEGHVIMNPDSEGFAHKTGKSR